MDPYDLFRRDVERCMACPLVKTRQQVVVDRGNPKAKLVFVGEAPGQHEDEIGEAFVGKSGDLLDQMLGEFRLTEADFVLLNVLKCRPVNNEFPTQSVVKKCLPHLDRQLQLIDPKVVILTGSKAAQFVVWRSYPAAPRMDDLHGRWIQSQRLPLIEFLAMYHPAYLLRLERDSQRDFEREYDRCLEIIEWALDLIDNNTKPPVEPLVIGSQVLIERARKRHERTRTDAAGGDA